MTRIPTADEMLARSIVAIDGTSGSGKSTTARLVAERLGLTHIDTGAMYRAVTWAALERGMDLSDADALGALADGITIELGRTDDGKQVVRADGTDVSRAIREIRVTKAVSEVSAHPSVRSAMVREQRRLGRGGGVVLEGRDIGSVVFPWADVKVFMEATTRVRAERRTAELLAAGHSAEVSVVEADLIRRDEYDSSRETSPLVRPIGAWLVDTSSLTIEEQVQRVIDLARKEAEESVLRYQPPADGSNPREQRFIYQLARWLIKSVARVVFGLRIVNRMHGRLEEPYVFASNHIAYADPPVVGCTLRREAYFVAKAALFKNPVFGRLIAYFNAIPLKRGVFDRETMFRSRDLLLEGKSVMIFPEGGRVFGGKLGKTKSGVGYLVLNTGAAVIPCYVRGSDRLARAFLRREKLIVAHGPPIRVPREIVDEYRGKDDRDAYRAFSEIVMAAIGALKDDIDRI